MPLSWSMDKIGPICRSVEGAAIVFDSIHGTDGRDPTVSNFEFHWPSAVQVKDLKVGFVRGRNSKPVEEREDLGIIKALGCELVEVQLPEIPMRAMASIIDVEGAAVFDDLIRAGETEGWNSRKQVFLAANFISAIDYLRFQRVRTKLMRMFESAIEEVDVLFNASDLFQTNFTGHPSIAIPSSFRKGKTPTPISTIFTGHLNQDEKVLALAAAFQVKVEAHLKRPPIDTWLKEFDARILDEKKE